MKRLTVLGVACLLLAGVFSLTACTSTSNQEMYYYYMQRATEHEAAAVAEEVQAQYYAALAQEFLDKGLITTQEDYDKFMSVSNTHLENAKAYREVAEQYKSLAAQYQ